MDKENILTSVRFWSVVSAILLSIFVAVLDPEQIGKSPEEIRVAIVAIGLIVGTYVVGRTIRPGDGAGPEPFFRSVRFWNMVLGVGVVLAFLFVDVRSVGLTVDDVVNMLVSIGILSGTFSISRTVRNTGPTP